VRKRSRLVAFVICELEQLQDIKIVKAAISITMFATVCKSLSAPSSYHHSRELSASTSAPMNSVFALPEEL
jgi:hypothetical protein